MSGGHEGGLPAGDIVVIDDELTLLKLLGSLLEAEGYRVRSFASGSLALRSIEAETPDLILLDIRMPGLSGFEICEKLKADPDTASIPVIFLTAATDLEDKVKAFQAGGVDYLTKPFERVELLARVKVHIDHARAITKIRRITQELAHKELRYRLGFEGSPVGIAVVDSDGVLVEVNQALAEIVGRPAELIAGRESVASLSAPDESPSNMAVKGRMVSGLQPVASIRTAVINADGRRVPVRVDAARVQSDSDPVLFSFVTDLTDIEEKNQQLAYLAERDPLTGTLNRRGFLDHVQKSLDRGSGEGTCGVLFVDIDGFKMVNDVYGHRVGDLFLRAVATRLFDNTRVEGGQVGRLGGDEFAVLLADCGPSEVHAVARRLERCVRDPLIIDGATLALSCTIGQAVAGDSTPDAEELMACADQDMYASRRARAQGLEDKREELRQALDSGQLRTHFQPIWTLGSEGLTLHGYEALLRWDHPDHGVLPPGEFIHTAEEAGLIHRLDLWAGIEALRKLSAQPGLSVAINCSALTLAVPGMADELIGAIKAIGRDPASVTVELTESVDIPNSSQIMKSLNELRHEGILIALDDFGAGYAGLNNLRTLPIDIVKIDRSLVATLAEDSDQSDNTEHFLTGIRQLTHAMGTRLLAEGIENTRQLDLVRKLRFDYAQGFLLGRPSADEISRRSSQTVLPT